MLLLKTLKNEVQRDEVVIAEQRFELCLRGMIKKKSSSDGGSKILHYVWRNFLLSKA